MCPLKDLHGHEVNSQPRVYGKLNKPSKRAEIFVSTAFSDECSLHATLAFCAYSQMTSRRDPRTASSIQTTEEIAFRSKAAYHVFEAIRLLNKKFENEEEALSISSMFSAAVLAGCTVRASISFPCLGLLVTLELLLHFFNVKEPIVL